MAKKSSFENFLKSTYEFFEKIATRIKNWINPPPKTKLEIITEDLNNGLNKTKKIFAKKIQEVKKEWGGKEDDQTLQEINQAAEDLFVEGNQFFGQVSARIKKAVSRVSTKDVATTPIQELKITRKKRADSFGAINYNRSDKGRDR